MPRSRKPKELDVLEEARRLFLPASPAVHPRVRVKRLPPLGDDSCGFRDRAGVLVFDRAVKPWLALLSVVSVALITLGPAVALAAPPAGPWVLGPITETFTIQMWRSVCGPAPVSGTLGAGGPVTIRSDGPELVMTGAQGSRVLRTDECLDAMPTLTRAAHSADDRTWRTRCETPPSDPRHAVINTAYFLSPDEGSISVAETGRYELRIEGARCVADVKRSGVLERAPAVPAPVASAVGPSAAAPTRVPAAHVDCSEPGAPARLEVRPSRKLLRADGDSFRFRAAVLDASGCLTPTTIRWSLDRIRVQGGSGTAGKPTIDAATGRLTLPAQGYADMLFDVVATAAGRSARASVEVTSAANYEALLAQSGLDSQGERGDPAVVEFATASLGGSSAPVENGARRRRMVFLAVVGVLSLSLGIVAVLGARRARRARALERAAGERHADKMREYERTKREREELHAAQMKQHRESVAVAQQQAAAAAARGLDPGPMFCPSCRREHPAGSTFCAFDANRLLAVSGHAELMTGPAGGVCPACKRGFNPGVKTCPYDGEDLLPASIATTTPTAFAPLSGPTRGKICPTCGEHFDGAARFCGKDGTQLVLVN